MSDNTEEGGLVERLRETHTCDGCGEYVGSQVTDLLDEAATALASERAAHAETKRALDGALKALEPFADIADLIDSETEGMSETDELALHFHDYLMASWPVALFRAARRVREGGEANG